MDAPVAIPDWKVMLGGIDLSDVLRPRLTSLRISERRGDEADQLDIVLDDSGQTLEIPKAGAILSVSLGWKGGGGTTPGLIDKGKFIVDEAEHKSPPDTITIRGRSADLTGEWRKVRDGSWRDTTLGKVMTAVAARQNVTPRISADLAGKKIMLVTQSRESDIALIKRLGDEHDAVATIKGGALIVVPMAGGKSASGQSLPTATINRREGDGHSYRIEAREDYTGVIAKWHDKKSGTQKTVKAVKVKRAKKAKPRSTPATPATPAKPKPTTTSGNADNPKTLKKVYPTQAEAKRAADAEWSRIQRAPRKLSLKLALGRPDIGAEQPAVVIGFHPEIDAQDWIVADVTHSLDRSGLTTSLGFELPEKPADSDSGGDESTPTQPTEGASS
jgi:uncharacterized protein